jgi:zinc protease
MNAILQQGIESKTCANGLSIHALNLPHAPRLALNIYASGGNRYEPEPGLQDVLDRLLLKGTTTRDQEAFAIALDSLSLELDTDTRRDCSMLAASLLPEDWSDSLALIGDVMANATFDEFDREKERMLGEIAMDLDAPKAKASDRMTRTLFDGHVYGITGSKVLEQLPALSNVDSLKRHYTRLFHPATTHIVLAGPLPKTWQADLDQLFAPLSAEMPIAVGPVAPVSPVVSQRLHIPVPDSSQCHIFQAWLLPAANHPDYTAMQVLNTILGGAGLSARLFTELRDKQGLAYNVRSSMDAFEGCGVFNLYIGTEPKNRERCIDGFDTEIKKLVDIPVAQQELDEAKRNVVGRRALGLETAHQQAGLIGNTLMLGRSLDTIATFEQRILAITSADIQRVAQTYLTQPSLITFAGP